MMLMYLLVAMGSTSNSNANSRLPGYDEAELARSKEELTTFEGIYRELIRDSTSPETTSEGKEEFLRVAKKYLAAMKYLKNKIRIIEERQNAQNTQ